MKDTKNFTLTAMFSTILVLLTVTPLDFVPVGPINATTMHIPVIIASIVLGPKLGAFLDGTFGLISMIRSTVIQTPLSFVFSLFILVTRTEHGSWKALLIAFIPRTLVGVVPYFVYKDLRRLMEQKAGSVSLFLAGFSGSSANTILVMNMIYFLFQQDYAKVIGANLDAIYSTILAIIFTSSISKGIVVGLATAAVYNILLRYFEHPFLTN